VIAIVAVLAAIALVAVLLVLTQGGDDRRTTPRRPIRP
jgi:hypothetical protein